MKCVRVDKDSHAKLKNYSLLSGKTLAACVAEALAEYIYVVIEPEIESIPTEILVFPTKEKATPVLAIPLSLSC